MKRMKSLWRLLPVAMVLMMLAVVTAACKDDEGNKSLRFDKYSYEVNLYGDRYVPIVSGNGDYILEMANPEIAAAYLETGWSAGPMILVRGKSVGTTQLKVTDKATLETKSIEIKVIDSNLALQLISIDGAQIPRIFSGAKFLFLVEGERCRAYLFEQGEQTATSSGLKQLKFGTYEFSNFTGTQAELRLTLSTSMASSNIETATFIVMAPTKTFGTFNQYLNLGWDSSKLKAIINGELPVTEDYSANTLWESEGSKVNFAFEKIQIPEGVISQMQ